MSTPELAIAISILALFVSILALPIRFFDMYNKRIVAEKALRDEKKDDEQRFLKKKEEFRELEFKLKVDLIKSTRTYGSLHTNFNLLPEIETFLRLKLENDEPLVFTEEYITSFMQWYHENEDIIVSAKSVITNSEKKSINFKIIIKADDTSEDVYN